MDLYNIDTGRFMFRHVTLEELELNYARKEIPPGTYEIIEDNGNASYYLVCTPSEIQTRLRQFKIENPQEPS